MVRTRVLSFSDLDQFTVYAAAMTNAGSCYVRLGELMRSSRGSAA